MLKRIRGIVGMLLASAMMTIGTASADLASDLSNISTVITSVTDWVTDILAVFMQPPLVIFVGIGIALIIIRTGKKLLRR